MTSECLLLLESDIFLSLLFCENSVEHEKIVYFCMKFSYFVYNVFEYVIIMRY